MPNQRRAVPRTVFSAERVTLSDAQFQRISQLIYQRAGIVLASHKRDMVFNRLVRRLRVLGLSDFASYLARHARDRPAGYSVWSAAASTGEEPYSIAMTLQETLGVGNQAQILGSDINSRVLETARNGIYREEYLRGLSLL